ncbi:MAG: transglutaminaseTgpA domain-containing protein [Ancrocorticia sp.]
MSDTSTHHSPTWVEQAEREQLREESSRRRSEIRRRGRLLVRELRNPLSVGGLLIVAALSHGGVFGDASGYLASVGGVLVGSCAAGLAAHQRLGYFYTVMAILAAYLVTGGPLAIPETTTAFVVPSLQTLQMLVLGIVTSWKDLLTLQPPAGDFVGPAIMPFFSAVMCSAVAMTIILRTTSPLWALIPVALLLFFGILWGSQTAPLAFLIGIALGAGGLIWSAWVIRWKQRGETYETIEFARVVRTSRRRAVSGGIVLVAVGVAAALVTVPLLTADGHRTVLRDVIEPPLDLRYYHSPISQFRWLTTTAEDTELFTVKGLSTGGRIRLAALDQYDGTVFKISEDDDDADFRRVGASFTDDPLEPATTTTSLHVSISDYADYWVPGSGQMRSFIYGGMDKQDLADSLYFSENLGTVLSTRRLHSGDEYVVVAVAERSWTDAELEGKAILDVALPENSHVPEVIGERAAEIVDGMSPGIGQVRAIQQRLSEDGFYSDGTDGLSLPGHRADRLERFLKPSGMIGNDEQYAAVMALMLRSQGIPARVVMGFYPEKEPLGAVTITGGDTHVWVEVPFEDAGWVVFDPTPPEDQTPRTDYPEPKPNPRPQVLQPPDPPEDPAEVPPDAAAAEKDEEGPGLSGTAILILQIGGLLGIVLLPFLLIVVTKAHRSRRRRRRGSQDVRIAGAWDEVVDSAIDLGVTVPALATRFEQAWIIDAATQGGPQEGCPGPAPRFHRRNEEMPAILALATRLDQDVFGEDELTEESCERAWAQCRVVMRSLRRRMRWRHRIRARISLRSLHARGGSGQRRRSRSPRAEEAEAGSTDARHVNHSEGESHE